MNKLIVLIISAVLLSSCSLSSNVKSEWDCPAPTGKGCIDIKKADEIALDKLGDNTATLQASKVKSYKEIWFAPFTDETGNYYEASIVRYKE